MTESEAKFLEDIKRVLAEHGKNMSDLMSLWQREASKRLVEEAKAYVHGARH